MGTDYTNNTGKPIYFTATCNSDDALMRLTVDGIIVATNGDNGSTSLNTASVSMIILPNEVYSITCTKNLTYVGYVI